MNLSSCVTDSLLLSLDSAGQTLGTGTSPPHLSSLQPSASKPDELGVPGEGERATESWERCGGRGASPWAREPQNPGKGPPRASPQREQKKDPAGNTFPVVFQADTELGVAALAEAGGTLSLWSV